MDDKTTQQTYRPQFLRTPDIELVPAKKAGDWPEAWKGDADIIKMVTAHQQWLALDTTRKARLLLQDKISRLGQEAAQLAVTPGVSSEIVRCKCAEMNALIELEKTTYDTEKYVDSITKHR